MGEDNSLKLFEDKNIRVKWNDEEEKWYFSVVDVVAILSPSVKGWNDVTTKSGRVTLAINFDDIQEAVNAEISARNGN